LSVWCYGCASYVDYELPVSHRLTVDFIHRDQQ
jgi:hypothetical protein